LALRATALFAPLSVTAPNAGKRVDPNQLGASQRKKDFRLEQKTPMLC
jgi:hypothetical protein